MNNSRRKKAQHRQAGEAWLTHLIVTATRIIIIPTDNMAMMTPHIMNQTLLFGSSAINKKKTLMNKRDDALWLYLISETCTIGFFAELISQFFTCNNPRQTQKVDFYNSCNRIIAYRLIHKSSSGAKIE